jgi:hypothetical protein
MPHVPPWLSMNPASMAMDAIQAGESVALKKRQLSDSEQQARDAAAMDAAKTAMSMQLAARGAALQEAKFRSDQQMNVLSAQMAKDNADKSYQYKMQQLAVSRELGARRSEAAAQAVAQKYQQAQSYQRKANELVSSGVPMSEAAVQASMLTGHFPAGMASLMRPQKQQETWSESPDNKNILVSSLGNMKMKPRTKKFSEPYTDENGAVLVKEIDTNEPHLLYKPKDTELGDLQKKTSGGDSGEEKPKKVATKQDIAKYAAKYKFDYAKIKDAMEKDGYSIPETVQ